MKESTQSILQWHRDSFPDADLAGQLIKWQEEKKEWASCKKTDISELADCYIVACGLARYPGLYSLLTFSWIADELGASEFCLREFEQAVDSKMEINRARKWERKGGLYKHTKGDNE